MNSVALEQLFAGTPLPAGEATGLLIQPDSGWATGSELLGHLPADLAATTSGELMQPPERLIQQALTLIDWWHRINAYDHWRGRIPAFLVADRFAEGAWPCDFCERECEYELN